MTEQEKREKTIEEMRNDIPQILNSYIDKPMRGVVSNHIRDGIARTLVDKGYRKEEEVQKETAREILTIIASDFYSIGDGYFELTKHDIQELMQKYGVEVEE